MYFGRTFVNTSIAPPYHLLQSTAEPSLLSASLSSKDDIVLSPCLRDFGSWWGCIHRQRKKLSWRTQSVGVARSNTTWGKNQKVSRRNRYGFSIDFVSRNSLKENPLVIRYTTYRSESERESKDPQRTLQVGI